MTNFNADPLPFAELDPEEECECRDPKKRPRRLSNVVANVRKDFKRRMSQNSLDNLK